MNIKYCKFQQNAGPEETTKGKFPGFDPSKLLPDGMLPEGMPPVIPKTPDMPKHNS